ncbi:PfkB family carbohydrate kinase [Streptomonospora nanhaiensis]|uniref:PfkB family carbohydrate kinase n=1 Tax=Streptomonospora nanhaiensis TaxID=1323731 RepID=UPI001C395C27|nr:PfkB family carbohydrate kinase [Streptomonospora nanhaiensis]MBV2367223.1 adenylyltransferase/cytidyltransferase family protein [Streptomonospora nanhaiensis]
MTPAPRPPLVVVGDAFLDVDLTGERRVTGHGGGAPVLDAPSAWHRPGGAALAAWLAARDGHPVTLVCALAQDPAGDRVAALLRDAVTLVRLPLDGGTPVKTRVQFGGRTALRVDHGEGRPDPAGGQERAAAAVAAAGAVLVSDYGRGVAELPGVRSALARAAASVPLVWDPHPRGPVPVPGAALVTPNASEAGARDADRAAARAAELARAWRAESVAVTLGAEGAVWAAADGRAERLAAPLSLPDADACGAGDRFCAVAAGALRTGADVVDAVAEGVQAASRFVRNGAAGGTAASGPIAGALPLGLGESAGELAERVRRSGGKVVAAGGCFDVLHAGHVSLLRRARSLGDCLIVCINSDATVRARKGTDRPINSAEDRIRVLSALDCVDAVAVFDEPTPSRLIARLRPDVWVKGGDYEAAALPELDVVESLGGEVVILPRLPGRSTTRVVAARDRTPP